MIPQNLITIHCANCVVEFGITQEYWSRRKQDGKSFSCPNGHGNAHNPRGDDDDDSELGNEEDTPEDESPPADDAPLGGFKYKPIKIG